VVADAVAVADAAAAVVADAAAAGGAVVTDAVVADHGNDASADYGPMAC
jgi:hypothetical protein